MSTVKNSVFCRFILAFIEVLRRGYRSSVLSAALHRFGAGCKAAWAGSALGAGLRNSASVPLPFRGGNTSKENGTLRLSCISSTTLICP